MTLRCIAVDDEPLALGLVSTFINKTPFLELKKSFLSAIEALHYIQHEEVDVIFLDIQMPDLTGLELARILEKSTDKNPRIIFTTAFNQFAIDGYRVDALDYLLKPFNYEEFLRAATKAKNHIELIRKAVEVNNVPTSSPKEGHLFLKVEYQIVRVTFNDILYIEGLKDYVKVHLQNTTRPLLSLTSLKSLEEKLSAHEFMRIHRSYIINLNKIVSISRSTVTIGTDSIPISDQYKDEFNRYLSRWM